MKRIKLSILLLVFIIVLSGCNEIKPDSYRLYEIISANDLENEEVSLWYEKNYRTYGYHSIYSDEIEYILIGAGEKPTGGYRITIEYVKKEDNGIILEAYLNEPKEGDAVTEAITYPHLLLKIIEDNKTNVKVDINFYEQKKPEEKHQSEIMIYEEITGVFVRRIDYNHIEIDIDDDITFKQIANISEDPMTFKVNDRLIQVIESLKDSDNVKFSCYQDYNGDWVIDEIINLGIGNLIRPAKGIFVTRIDANYIEVAIDGESTTFKYSEQYEGRDGAGTLTENTAVYLEYVRNNQGELEVCSIGDAPRPGVGLEPSIKAFGTFIRFEMDNLCVVSIDSQSEHFWVAEELKASAREKLNENDSIEFEYYRDDYGREVIVSIDKVSKDIKIDTGRLAEINGDVIKIKISGTPENIMPKEFKLNSEAKNKLEGLELKMDEEVKIYYYINDGELNTIVDIERL